MATDRACVLALDTSGFVGSVAVGSSDRVLASLALTDRREHSARIVPAIAEALERAGVTRADLTGIVVGEGPGSFTGVRVAASTAKGLAHALGLDLWGFSSLAAAAAAEDSGSVHYVLFDARHDRVYGACYATQPALGREWIAPHGGTIADVLGAPIPEGAIFVGDGAWRHRATIERAGHPVAPATQRSFAEGLLRLHAAAPTLEPVERASWEPRYVRPSSAEASWTG